MKWTEARRKYYREYMREYRKKYFKRCPWVRTYTTIVSRCSTKKNGYFRRGIKNFLTIADLKCLWFRDKAYLMKQQSIDRINGQGDYTKENCRYIELKNNNSRPKFLQYKFDGKWSKKFDNCKICYTKKILHKGKGLCRKCYEKMRIRK